MLFAIGVSLVFVFWFAGVVTQRVKPTLPEWFIVSGLFLMTISLVRWGVDYMV